MNIDRFCEDGFLVVRGAVAPEWSGTASPSCTTNSACGGSILQTRARGRSQSCGSIARRPQRLQPQERHPHSLRCTMRCSAPINGFAAQA